MTENGKRPLGPNARRLIATKMAKDAIPSGGGVKAALQFLSTKESIVSGARSASQWVCAAIDAVRAAGDPNPWKHSTDEEIAAELLRQIDERKRTASGART